MTEEEYKELMKKVDEVYYTKENLEETQREVEALRKELEAKEKELSEKERQLSAKRKKLQNRMTDAELRWEALKRELDELLYDSLGIVTQLRDGVSGPFEKNDRIKFLCGEACKLIKEQGYADIDQFNYFVLLQYELAIRLNEDTSFWLLDYIDSLNDELIVPPNE